MANKTRTYKSSDWSIWTFVPQANTFVLDFSKLDGADTLGTSAGSMEVLDARITNIQLQEGGPASFGVIPNIALPTMTADLVIPNFTLSDTKSFYIGQAIWLTLKNEQTVVDVTYGTNTPFFIGIINDFNVTVTPEANFSTVTLSAATAAQDELNTQLRVTKNTTDPKDLVLYNAGEVNTPVLNFSAIGDSPNHYADTSVETKSFGEWLDDLALTDQCIIYTNQVPFYAVVTELVYDWALTVSYPTAESVMPTLDGSVITDVMIGWDCNEAPTAVQLTNYKTPTTIVTQQVGEGTNNRTSFAQTVDVKDSTEMSTIATKLLSVSKELRPIQVTIRLARQYQEIEFQETFITSGEWLWPMNYIRLSRPVKIDLPEFGISAQKTLIVGRTISIDQEQVLLTYDLTKGFIY